MLKSKHKPASLRRRTSHMGITLLTKEITPKNIFYLNEIQYRDDVPTKRKVGM